jgi:hypothetical protein
VMVAHDGALVADIALHAGQYSMRWTAPLFSNTL